MAQGPFPHSTYQEENQGQRRFGPDYSLTLAFIIRYRSSGMLQKVLLEKKPASYLGVTLKQS